MPNSHSNVLLQGQSQHTALTLLSTQAEKTLFFSFFLLFFSLSSGAESQMNGKACFVPKIEIVLSKPRCRYAAEITAFVCRAGELSALSSHPSPAI